MAITVKRKILSKAYLKANNLKPKPWIKYYETEDKLKEIAPECLEKGPQDYNTYPQFNKDEYLENFIKDDVEMNCLDLFSGIGGFSVACHEAGIKTVGYCDNESYTIKVMKKNFKDVLHFDDVCTLTKKMFDRKWKDEKPNEEIPSVQIVTAGSCCQGYSSLGLQRGNDDARSLQLQAIRIAQEFRSPWLVFENVDQFTDMALTSLLSDMANAGYQTESFLAPASAVNAIHTRYRAIIVGFNENFLLQYPCSDGWTNGYTVKERPGGGSEELGRANDACRRGFNGRPLDKPGISRTINGIPAGLDESITRRLHACGNSVVPQFIYPFVRHIKLVHTLLVKDQQRMSNKNDFRYRDSDIKIVGSLKEDAVKLNELKNLFKQVDGLIYYNYQCKGDMSNCKRRHEKYQFDNNLQAERVCKWYDYSKLPSCWMNINDLDEFNSGEKIAELFDLGEYKDNRWLYDMIFDKIIEDKIISINTSDKNSEEFNECIAFWTTLETQIRVLKCNVFYRRG